MRLLSIAVLFGALTLSASSAFADTFNFSFQGDDTGSGAFTVTTTSIPGEYTITDISGTMNKSTITGLLPAGTYPPGSILRNDNELFYPGPYLDIYGVAFTLSNNNKVNIYYDRGYFIAKGAQGDNFDVLTNFTVTPASSVTPEPSQPCPARHRRPGCDRCGTSPVRSLKERPRRHKPRD